MNKLTNESTLLEWLDTINSIIDTQKDTDNVTVMLHDNSLTAKDIAINGNLSDLASKRGLLGNFYNYSDEDQENNLDNLFKTGIWYVDGNSSGRPEGSGEGIVSSYVYDSIMYHMFMDSQNTKFHIRKYVGSSWEPWTEIVTGEKIESVEKNIYRNIPNMKSSISEVELAEDGFYWVPEDYLPLTSTVCKHIGEIFLYAGKGIPFGALRLDGQSIVGLSGAFPDFKKWAIDDGNVVTCILSEYETELSLYEDQCGKFGWDAATDTLRLPRISHFVGSTLTVDNISKAVKAGLPNITGGFRPSVQTSASGDYTLGTLKDFHGAFTRGGSAPSAYFSAQGTTNAAYDRGVDFNAARSSSVYGGSNTVTPAHVKFPYFIHMYNSIVPASEAQASEFTGLVDGLRQDVPELATNICLPLSGGIMTGKIQWKNTGENTSIGFSINEGAYINFFRSDDQSNPGGFTIVSNNGTDQKFIRGLPSGALQWDGKNIEVIEAISNYIKYSGGLLMCWGRQVNDGGINGKNITFPTAFVSPPSVVATYSAPSLSSKGIATVAYTTYFNIKSDAWEVAWIAIGRWK